MVRSFARNELKLDIIEIFALKVEKSLALKMLAISLFIAICILCSSSLKAFKIGANLPTKR